MEGTGTGGNHRLFELELFPGYGQGVRPRKAAFAQEDIDPFFGVAPDRIDMTDVGLDAANALHHLVKMHFGPIGFNPKFVRHHDFAHRLGRANDGFGGDTAHIQAITAHQMFFNQRHLAAQPSRHNRCQ